MSMLLASAWLALRRIDETGDVILFAIHQDNTGRCATRGRSCARPVTTRQAIAHQVLEAE